ncbi:hypothetical protein K1719_012099 [Acacia pycnantha]|nr:hypothetical protein K1719_012099 [Acacia pycnantha]
MKPFRRTLIVKLKGRQISYGFMVKKLRLLWAKKGDIDVFDMENEFYLINFQHNDDYMEALVGGPWVIADAYLNVSRWRPDFNPKNAKIDSVVAVAYESLVMVCQRCGRVGHRLEACRGDQEVNLDKEMEVETEDPKPDAVIEKEDMGGRWKNVTRAKRPRINIPVTRDFQRASRFNVLMEEERAGEQALNEEGSQQQFQRKSGPSNLAEKVQEGKQSNWVGGNNGISNGDKGLGLRKNKDVNPNLGSVDTRQIRQFRSWGFKQWSKVEADGYSGGIWIVWERDDLVLDALIKEGQFLHCRIRIGESSMLFTVVYASPNEQRRRGLWDNLQEIATSECDLIDVESKGPFYTWKGPKWDGLDRVYKRLDRCLCNISWLEKFVDAEVGTLPRLCSDHHPLFVSLLPEIYTPRVRTFRYEAMCQMHENFTDIVSGSWRGDDEAHMKLSTLKQDLMVLIGKYGRQHDLIRGCKTQSTDSDLWKNLARIWPRVTENVCWELGDGKKIKFWQDNWIEGGQNLRHLCLGALPDDAEEIRVADMSVAAGCYGCYVPTMYI